MDRLAKSVGQSITRLHGYPNYRFAEIPHPFSEAVGEEEYSRKIKLAASLVEEVLLKTPPSRRKQ